MDNNNLYGLLETKKITYHPKTSTTVYNPVNFPIYFEKNDLIHILSDNHGLEFENIFGCNDPFKTLIFILETIKDQKGVVIGGNGGTFYAFKRFNLDETYKIFYLAVYIHTGNIDPAHSEPEFRGKITTAYHVTRPTLKTLCDEFFDGRHDDPEWVSELM